MTDTRQAMNASLKNIVVLVLRRLGFRGSFSNIYPALDSHINLLSFQFRLSRESFVVELSYAEPERQDVYFDKEAQADKLRVSQTSRRLQFDAQDPGSDSWFSFEPTGLFKLQPNYNQVPCCVSAGAVAE